MAPSSYENHHPQKAFGWAARDPSGIMSPFNFSRRHVTRVTHSILTGAILESDLYIFHLGGFRFEPSYIRVDIP